MALSRKHYRAVAADIRANVEADRASGDAAVTEPRLRSLAEDLAASFKIDNGRFDRSRFLDACGFDQ